MPRLTMKTINAAIKAAGGKEELVAGKGYFFFVNVGPHGVPSSSVCVYRLNQLTLDQWMRELEAKRKEVR